jgi:cysteine desulfurase / selenocysteine lyase
MKKLFYGTDVVFKNVNDDYVHRVYFDSAASTLAFKPAQKAVNDFLKYYSNTHSTVHLTAKISTEIITWSSDIIKDFFSCNENHSIVYLGSGVTSPINRLARGLKSLNTDKNKALVSIMEHHSNDLPHRVNNEETLTIPVFDKDGRFVGIQPNMVKEIFENSKGLIKYVAITAVSNVSGHLNPIYDIAEIAHEYGAYIIVDGAQAAAHIPINMSQENPNRNIDFFVFSGHKVYSPGSPGVLIARSDLLRKMQPEFYGGGMVSSVTINDYIVSEGDFDKEHAGTLNIPGIYLLANVIKFLKKEGIFNIYSEEIKLTNYMIGKLRDIENINIYVDSDIPERVGVVSFNLKRMPHQLLSSILNDYFGIAVRNDCFCAHPYVRECLIEELWDFEGEDLNLYQGMVRASIGIYTTKHDIDLLYKALTIIDKNRSYYENKYFISGESFRHISCSFNIKDYFDPDAIFEKSFS